MSDDYGRWKSRIRSRLEAFEGEGPPDADTLWFVVENTAQGVVGRVGDMPVSEDEIDVVKGDVLKMLVALEMAEGGLDGSGDDDE